MMFDSVCGTTFWVNVVDFQSLSFWIQSFIHPLMNGIEHTNDSNQSQKKRAISSLFLQLSAIVANNMELIFRNGKMIPLKLEIKSKIIVGSENREA